MIANVSHTIARIRNGAVKLVIVKNLLCRQIFGRVGWSCGRTTWNGAIECEGTTLMVCHFFQNVSYFASFRFWVQQCCSDGCLDKTDDYDADDDFAKSLEEAYRVIRERKAAGGQSWEPK